MMQSDLRLVLCCGASAGLALVGGALSGSQAVLAAGMLSVAATVDGLERLLSHRALAAASDGNEALRSEIHLRVGHGLFLLALSAAMVSVLSPPAEWTTPRTPPSFAALVFVGLALILLPRRHETDARLLRASRLALATAALAVVATRILPPPWVRIDDGATFPIALLLWGLSLTAFVDSVRAFAGLNRGGVAEVQVRRTAASIEGVAAVTKARLRKTGEDLHVYVAVTAAEGASKVELSRSIRDAILREVEEARQVIVYVQSLDREGGVTAEGAEPSPPPPSPSLHRAPILVGVVLAATLFSLWIGFAGAGPLAGPAAHGTVTLLWLALPAFAGVLPRKEGQERLERRLAVALAGCLPLLAVPWAAAPGLGLGLLAFLCYLAADFFFPGGPFFDPRPRALPRKLGLILLLLAALALSSRGPGDFDLRFGLLLGGVQDRLSPAFATALPWLMALAVGLAWDLGPWPRNGAERLGRALMATVALFLGGPLTAAMLPLLLARIQTRFGEEGERSPCFAGSLAALMATVSCSVALRWALLPAALVIPTLAIIPSLRRAEVHEESSKT